MSPTAFVKQKMQISALECLPVADEDILRRNPMRRRMRTCTSMFSQHDCRVAQLGIMRKHKNFFVIGKENVRNGRVAVSVKYEGTKQMKLMRAMDMLFKLANRAREIIEMHERFARPIQAASIGDGWNLPTHSE